MPVTIFLRGLPPVERRKRGAVDSNHEQHHVPDNRKASALAPPILGLSVAKAVKRLKRHGRQSLSEKARPQVSHMILGLGQITFVPLRHFRCQPGLQIS